MGRSSSFDALDLMGWIAATNMIHWPFRPAQKHISHAALAQLVERLIRNKACPGRI